MYNKRADTIYCHYLQKKKGTEKKKSILELFREELKRCVPFSSCSPTGISVLYISTLLIYFNSVALWVHTNFVVMVRHYLSRAQVERKERYAAKAAGSLPLDAPDTTSDIFKVRICCTFMHSKILALYPSSLIMWGRRKGPGKHCLCFR